MESAAHAAGKHDRATLSAENALAYVELLRDHIAKEDGILYPLAERVIPEGMRAEILEGYRDAEAGRAADFSGHYREIVENYERE